ncbi:protein trichome birefringence-like [Actinidia eriantha]|uniref:protein trichome birefringence-like n=1 Tax=Actinidia eriantha TaxID=165200 RepID=UPI00258D3B94|nr:protein trichome birefringence-like [Actinidia eriantha]
MAYATKYASINGGTLISELKGLFSLRITKRTLYGFMFVSAAFFLFLAFNPSLNSSSPWFTNIFTSPTSINIATTSPPSSISSGESYRSHFSSIFSLFFPNSSQSVPNVAPPSPNNFTRSQNTTFQSHPPKNQTRSNDLRDKVEVFKPNQSNISPSQTENSVPKSSKAMGNGEKKVIEKGVNSNFSSSQLKKQSRGTHVQRSENLADSLMNCELFDGKWVEDDSYPLYKPGSCSLIDEQFNCVLNGRPDNSYHKLKWKPKGCSLPRLNGTHMLEMLRGKRLVFVGDSLNRNMWESLVCILRNSVKDQRNVYEAFGRHHFRTEASHYFVFKDYNCTVEFFVSPFLVQEWEMPDKNGSKKETLRLDMMGMSADQYKNADVLIFNTGHWWTHEKTSKGKDYYQEGSHVYGELDALEAFRKALTTWARWVDANVNPTKTLVLFRGYSASHFSGGQWNSGGQCDHETEPIKNETYLSPYPPMMTKLESVLKGMTNKVSYLNVTRMTDYRKDGHPSIYRKQNLSKEEIKSPLSIQDCSHWCLPGVPDSWNELLYAELLRKQNRKHQEHKTP